MARSARAGSTWQDITAVGEACKGGGGIAGVEERKRERGGGGGAGGVSWNANGNGFW